MSRRAVSTTSSLHTLSCVFYAHGLPSKTPSAVGIVEKNKWNNVHCQIVVKFIVEYIGY